MDYRTFNARLSRELRSPSPRPRAVDVAAIALVFGTTISGALAAFAPIAIDANDGSNERLATSVVAGLFTFAALFVAFELRRGRSLARSAGLATSAIVGVVLALATTSWCWSAALDLHWQMEFAPTKPGVLVALGSATITFTCLMRGDVRVWFAAREVEQDRRDSRSSIDSLDEQQRRALDQLLDRAAASQLRRPVGVAVVIALALVAASAVALHAVGALTSPQSGSHVDRYVHGAQLAGASIFGLAKWTQRMWRGREASRRRAVSFLRWVGSLAIAIALLELVELARRGGSFDFDPSTRIALYAIMPASFAFARYLDSSTVRFWCAVCEHREPQDSDEDGVETGESRIRRIAAKLRRRRAEPDALRSSSR